MCLYLLKLSKVLKLSSLLQGAQVKQLRERCASIHALSMGTLCRVTGSRHARVPASSANTAFFAPLMRATPSGQGHTLVACFQLNFSSTSALVACFQHSSTSSLQYDVGYLQWVLDVDTATSGLKLR